MYLRSVCVALLAGCTFVACGTGGAPNSGGGPTLQAIQITSSATMILLGASAQLTATGSFSDGNTKDITNMVEWNASPIGVATIKSSGLLTARKVGNATVQATSGSVHGIATVSITARTPAFLFVGGKKARPWRRTESTH